MATVVFVVAFIMFMGIAIIRFWKIRHQQVNAIASIVTVIGVLGTFAGIAWGLLNFDTGDIEASVPKLLGGLKVAFLTSIVGIGGSIYLKWSTLNKQQKQSTSEQTTSGATVDDLANLLNEILGVAQKEGRATRESLRAVEKSLTGEGESTVVTQLQRLRITFSDKQDEMISKLVGKQDELKRAFDEFAKKMAEENIKTFIEALKETIKEFNEKISEQFGDNFKQLNEAVGRLNDWQEEYRQQMSQLAEAFRIAAESVEQSRQSLEVIADKSNVVVSAAESLNPILQGIQHQIHMLNASLDAFSTLADNARDAFPIIETRLDQLTNGFSNAVQTTIDDSHSSMERQREALAEQSQQLERTVVATGNHIQQQTAAIFERTSEEVQSLIQNFSDTVRNAIDNAYDDVRRQREAFQDFTGRIETVIRETSDGLQRTLEDTNRRLESTFQSQLDNLNSEMQRIFQEISIHMRQQLTALDESLGEELTQVLSRFGDQLTSVSNRFVADYTPLTERLHDVVEIARNIPSSSDRNTQR